MAQAASDGPDEKLDLVLGTLLRAGVLVASVVVLVGAVPYLVHNGGLPTDRSEFVGEPEALRSPAAILRGALGLQSRAVIQLGLLLLMATPVARVAFTVAAFWRRRDRVYVAVTTVVLAILLYSLFWGQVAG